MLTVFSFPLALFFGSMGLRYDQPRTLALICTLISGGCICFYLTQVGASLYCR